MVRITELLSIDVRRTSTNRIFLLHQKISIKKGHMYIACPFFNNPQLSIEYHRYYFLLWIKILYAPIISTQLCYLCSIVTFLSSVQ